MPNLWICEKISCWEQSLIAKLCCKHPVFLVEKLENLLQSFDLRPSQDLQGHLIINLDSFSASLEQARKLISPIKSTGFKVILSKEFPVNAKQEKSNSKTEYLLNPQDSTIHLEGLIESSTRPNAVVSNLIRYKNIEFSFEKMFLRFLPDGEPENLPLKEARLLRVLLQDPSKTWTRKELQQAVWDRLKVSPRTIDSHISRLRKKLLYTGINIESKYGGGYTIT